jgi:hypothetical protein
MKILGPRTIIKPIKKSFPNQTKKTTIKPAVRKGCRGCGK